MARLYADENFPLPSVEALRAFGHDVLTSQEAGQSNQSVPDDAVLAFASAAGRILITLNRRHFIRLHEESHPHSGIIVCTYDPDFQALAARVHALLSADAGWPNRLDRVNRPAP